MARSPKSLSLRHLNQVKAMKDPDEANLLVLSLGYGLERRDAEEWYDEAPAGEIVAAIQAVFDASGLGQAAQFQGGTVDDARPERPSV